MPGGGVLSLPSPTVTVVQQAGVNLLKNASFEEFAVQNSQNWSYFPGGIPGWSGGNLELQRGILGGSLGAQHIELDSTSSSAISQSVATIPGNTYTLSFAVRARPSTSAEDNELSVSIAGALEATGTGGTPLLIADSTNWQRHSYTFTAIGESVNVAFADAGTSNSFGTFLDEVSLTNETPSGNTAPEAFDGRAKGLIDTIIRGNLEATDADGDNFVFERENAPFSGTLRIMPNGAFTYEPDEGFIGRDFFTFSVTDELGLKSNLNP